MKSPSSAFCPKGLNKTVSLAVTGASQTITTDTGYIVGNQVRIANVGTKTVFLEFGASGTTPTAATATSIPMLANTVEVFTVPPLCVVAAIASDTGSTIYITPGEGL